MTSRLRPRTSVGCVVDEVGVAADVDANVDVLLPEDFGNGPRYIFVFTCNETRSELDDGDLTSKPAIHLSKFQTDIASSKHQQVPREKIHVHHRAICQIADIVEPRNRRDQCPSTHVDENLLGPERFIPNIDLFRPNKTSVALIDRAPFQRLQ